MSRNNPDRTGAHGSESAPPPEVLKTLDFVAPTEFVDLPCKGQYPEGHPLSGKDSLEIRFMTAKDEDILTNQSLLKKGLAIERFLQNVILDKTVKSEDLLICDRNAILVAARSSGYGSRYDTKVQCPNCGEMNQISFDLANPEVEPATYPDDYDISIENGQIFVTPPLTGFKIGLRLLTGRDENWLAKQMSDKKNKDKANITQQFRLMITSVQGDSSRATVDYYVDRMPTQDSRYLRAAYNFVSPSLKISEDLECHSCGYEQEMEVPFGADFFWPDR